MKALWIMGLFLIMETCAAQSYQFEKDKQVFSFLENPISINHGEAWDSYQQYDIKLPFSFPFMDKLFSKISLECTGRIIFDENHFYYFDALVTNQLQYKNTKESFSSISYKVISNHDTNAVVIEIKNAGFIDRPDDVINYQIYLHSNGTIVVHAGPSTSIKTLFLTGAFHQKSFSPFVYQYGLVAAGDPEHPKIITYQTEELLPPFKTINKAPTTGTIYRFSLIPSP